MDIVVHGSRNAVFVNGINNDQLPEALKQVLAECGRQYGSVPVKMEITTWDMDYGDVIPEAGIWAQPIAGCWAFDRRLKKAQEKVRGVA